MHAWAENPRTVGALAGTQMAIRASMSKSDDIKEKIRDAGGLPKYVAFMESNEVDRVHTGVVALSFLCTENPPNSHEV